MQVTNITEYPNRKIELMNFTEHSEKTVAIRQTSEMLPGQEDRIVLYEDEMRLLVDQLQKILAAKEM
jgi:hypothetical protein